MFIHTRIRIYTPINININIYIYIYGEEREGGKKKEKEKKKSCTRDVAVYNLQVNAKRVEHSTKRKKERKSKTK